MFVELVDRARHSNVWTVRKRWSFDRYVIVINKIGKLRVIFIPEGYAIGLTRMRVSIFRRCS